MILPKIVKSYNQNNHIIVLYQSDNIVLVFQSYDKVMLSINNNGIYLNEDLEDYTKTTSKYLYKAIDDILNDGMFNGYCQSSNITTLKYILSCKKSAILSHLSENNGTISNIGNLATATIGY